MRLHAQASALFRRLRSSRSRGEARSDGDGTLAAELEQALKRERLVARIGRKVRSELDLDAVLETAVRETGEALELSRVFVRLGEAGGPMPIEAEWDAPGFDPIQEAHPEIVPASKLAAQKQRTVVSADIAADPTLADPNLGGRELYEEIGTRAVLSTPVVVFDQMIGILALHRPEAWRWTDNEILLAEAVAREIGLAVHTARLLREDEERLAHLSSLLQERERHRSLEQGFNRIARILSETLSEQETLDALAHAASDALGASFSAVFLPMRSGLALAGSHRLPDPVSASLADGIPAGAEVLSICVEHGQVIASPQTGDDERFGKEWRRLARGSFDSLLAIPIETAQAGVNGLALVFFSDARLFTDDDLELARNLAQAAKGALERSSMFERERSSRALSQNLARIGAGLATELDPERVLSEVVRQVPELLDADSCAIHVLEGEELVVRDAAGEGTAAAVGSRTPSTAGLAGEVLQSRSPVAVEDVAESDPRRSADVVLSTGYAAYLGVPLGAAKEGLAGVLSAYSRRPREWREEEVEALSTLAANTSVSLSNAELYQQVAVEKERSETILASVADGIVAVDRDDRVVLWNAAAERIMGVPRKEAVGRLSADILRRTLSSGDEAPTGNRVVPIPRGGEDLWLSVSEAVLRGSAGDVAGRIFTFRDISSERLVEQVKTDFVSTVSHQLRAPLTSIYGFAETLLRNDVLFGDEERRTFLRYVVTESERLAAIVDTLLNVARLEAGDLEVELVPTDVRAVVDDSVALLRQTAPENGYELVVDLPPEPVAAEADAEKLRQVLANLLDNAIKFSPAGAKVTVSARAMRDRGTVEFEVADEGIGIPHAEQQLIFSKFYRSSDLELQEGAGAGLGLFIARGLVSAMGGDMRVSSLEGRGSTFAFELPLAVEAPV
jgi:two-component system, OmpR family, phosphate regulon sensor histidine kinase PhoR